ncbi:hypothetical protein MHPYR_500008 [uncultured Mycobacterium sp.]|uniref:Uncharacterized protein n=1 Tax=uncultured Mycobacterium sp. TaxID=171292 RepID=A0A1Y5PHC6_9MYCO|nr:hypothetical protein MHPYR_500008 [uncultured Mycobacterium sp.]
MSQLIRDAQKWEDTCCDRQARSRICQACCDSAGNAHCKSAGSQRAEINEVGEMDWPLTVSLPVNLADGVKFLCPNCPHVFPSPNAVILSAIMGRAIRSTERIFNRSCQNGSSEQGRAEFVEE